MLAVTAVSVDLTPPRPLPLAGLGSRTSTFARYADPLAAELVLIEDERHEPLVVGSLDCLFIGRDMLVDVAAACGLPPERLLLFATHTHNAPALDPTLPDLGRCDPTWANDVKTRITIAVKDLLQSPQRTSVTCAASRQATTLAISRRRPGFRIEYAQSVSQRRLIAGRGVQLAANRDHAVDSHVSTITFRDKAGAPVAIIWSIAAHASLYPDARAVSADFPGAVRREIKARYGNDCAVIYLPGLAGSSIPAAPWHLPANAAELIHACLPFNPRLPTFTSATFATYATELASAVLKTVERADSTEAARSDHSCVACSIRAARTDDIFISSNSSFRKAPSLDVTLLTLASRISILAFSGEMLDEWRPDLLPHLPPGCLLTGYAAGDATYLPTDAVRRDGGYEAVGFLAAFGMAGHFVHDLDAKVVTLVRELVAS